MAPNSSTSFITSKFNTGICSIYSYRLYIPYTGKFSRAKIFADRWFRVFRGKYFHSLNTSTGNETSMHFTQSTSTRRLGTILGHFSRIIFSRIATKTRNPRNFSTVKISRYTVQYTWFLLIRQIAELHVNREAKYSIEVGHKKVKGGIKVLQTVVSLHYSDICRGQISMT